MTWKKLRVNLFEAPGPYLITYCITNMEPGIRKGEDYTVTQEKQEFNSNSLNSQTRVHSAAS